jgi:hypothetical protein
VLYPAARWESLPELRATRAWIVVSRFGCDAIEKIENVPSDLSQNKSANFQANKDDIYLTIPGQITSSPALL